MEVQGYSRFAGSTNGETASLMTLLAPESQPLDRWEDDAETTFRKGAGSGRSIYGELAQQRNNKP
jgi:hypothetical protein